MSECKGIIWNGWRYDNCHRQFDECGRGPASDETKKAAEWAKHGPALLAAAKDMRAEIAYSRTKPAWDDAIADCEQIEGKDDAKD